jgi:hypothetical protein
MEPQSTFLALPPELVSAIFETFVNLHDLHALAGTCKQLRKIFFNAAGHYYDPILRRSLPAFEDALRAQRASVSAVLHLKKLDYANTANKNVFESMLPPAGTVVGPTPTVCRFDLDEGGYVNVPTEDEIIKLGETPIASAWEAQRVMQLHKIILYCRQSLGSDPSLGIWFNSVVEGASDWTPDREERFYRGAYRYWLYGYLFFPGCYLEPFFVEKQRILATALYKFSSDGEGYFSFKYERRNEVLEYYPLFIPVIDLDIREDRLELLFDGFIAWLVHDGEQRGEREQARGTSAPPSTPYSRSATYGDDHPSAAHGGMRELLLIYTMWTFLEDISSSRGQTIGIVSTDDRVPWTR